MKNAEARERWTLVVTFDPLNVQERADPESAFPRDDSSRLVACLSARWGLMPEEFQEVVEWTSERVVVHAEVLDHAMTALEFVGWQCVPRHVELRRNGSRL